MLIALCGRRRSGKDTVASYLVSEYCFNHHKISQPLKDALCILFDFTVDDIETDSKDHIHPKWGVSPRTLMQYIGTDIFRNHIQGTITTIKDDFWIKRAIVSLKKDDRIVISDLRFINEYEYLRQNYGDQLKVICINRFDEVDTSICGTHVSELEFIKIPYDYIINNTGDLESLYMQINTLLNQNVEVAGLLQD
jgi:hypothetical protein